MANEKKRARAHTHTFIVWPIFSSLPIAAASAVVVVVFGVNL